MFLTKPSDAWFKVLDDAGVPAEIVNEEFCRELFDDPEARVRELVAETWSGSVGRFEDPGLLVTMSPASGIVQRGPCMCGQHTAEILTELGLSTKEIQRLIEDKAVLDSPIEVPGES